MGSIDSCGNEIWTSSHCYNSDCGTCLRSRDRTSYVSNYGLLLVFFYSVGKTVSNNNNNLPCDFQSEKIEKIVFLEWPPICNRDWNWDKISYCGGSIVIIYVDGQILLVSTGEGYKWFGKNPVGRL